MNRIIGLDYGEKRIGVALSDPTRTIASPLLTLQRRPGKRPPWPELRKIVEENEVAEAVVGLPLGLSGDESAWTAEVRDFGAEVARRFSIPVHFVDERMTSVLAEQAVRGIGLKRSQREEKHRIDAAAAALILRYHLDRDPAAYRGSIDDAGD
jgi:putative holliday junction resolvase